MKSAAFGTIVFLGIMAIGIYQISRSCEAFTTAANQPKSQIAAQLAQDYAFKYWQALEVKEYSDAAAMANLAAQYWLDAGNREKFKEYKDYHREAMDKAIEAGDL